MRSGSTTNANNAEPSGAPEVSSRRTRASRQSARKPSAPPVTQAQTADLEPFKVPRVQAVKAAALPAIAELPLPQVQQGRSAQHTGKSREAGSMLKRQPSDTPAKHTRSRTQQQQQQGSSAQGAATPLPAPTVAPRGRVPGSAVPPRSSRRQRAEQQEVSAASSLSAEDVEDAPEAFSTGRGKEAEGDEQEQAASGRGEAQASEQAAVGRRRDDAHGSGGHGDQLAEEQLSSSEGDEEDGDDSEDEEEAGGAVLGRMAESMLAALGTLGRGGAGSKRPAAVKAASRGHGVPSWAAAAGKQEPGAGGREQAGEEEVQEMHWEPTLQLPRPAGGAGAAAAPAVLARAQPVPGKQVLLSSSYLYHS